MVFPSEVWPGAPPWLHAGWERTHPVGVPGRRQAPIILASRQCQGFCLWGSIRSCTGVALTQRGLAGTLGTVQSRYCAGSTGKVGEIRWPGTWLARGMDRMATGGCGGAGRWHETASARSDRSGVADEGGGFSADAGTRFAPGHPGADTPRRETPEYAARSAR